MTHNIQIDTTNIGMLRLLLVLLVVLCRAVTVWSECVPRIEIAYAPLDAFLHEIIVPLAKNGNYDRDDDRIYMEIDESEGDTTVFVCVEKGCPRSVYKKGRELIAFGTEVDGVSIIVYANKRSAFIKRINGSICFDISRGELLRNGLVVNENVAEWYMTVKNGQLISDGVVDFGLSWLAGRNPEEYNYCMRRMKSIEEVGNKLIQQIAVSPQLLALPPDVVSVPPLPKKKH